jgi:Ser/Thr protein kinase RdoA (MazF antagonist)
LPRGWSRDDHRGVVENEFEALLRGYRRRVRLPLEGLEELRALRATLDRLERVLVAEARSHASTWEEIGAALSVSRQAVHRRHRPSVNRRSGDSPRGSG